MEQVSEWAVTIFMLALPVVVLGGLLCMMFSKISSSRKAGKNRSS
jgi:hypothetical protein